LNCLEANGEPNGNKLFDIQKSPSSPGLHGAPFQAVLQFLCHILVLSFELINIVLVVFSYSSSWLTTAQLIGIVCVSSLKMFHPHSDTTGTHADISIP
jgi:hypothetical protein